jgi:hypothetical protein
MSELIPVLAAAGVLPLIGVFCILRGWSIARALSLLLATVTAIVTRKDYRRETCLEVVDFLTRKDEPPGWLRRRPVRALFTTSRYSRTRASCSATGPRCRRAANESCTTCCAVAASPPIRIMTCGIRSAGYRPAPSSLANSSQVSWPPSASNAARSSSSGCSSWLTIPR